MINDSEASNVNKKTTITNLAKPIGEIFAATNASSGLSETDGAGRVNINGTTGKTTPVAADAVMINDSEASNINKSCTLTNLTKAIGGVAAGTNASSALSQTNGVMRVNINGTTGKTEPVAADAVLINDSEASNVNKASTITNLAKPIGQIFAATNATSGLSEVDGAGRVNINGTTAKTAPVSADAVLINDSEDTNANKACTLANLAKPLADVMAGTQASTGLTDATGVLTVSPSDNAITVGADSLMYMTAAGVPKKDSVVDIATAMAGTRLSAAAGVLSVNTLGIADHTDDDKHSIFVMAGEIDFGESNPVTVDLGALGVKGSLIGGYFTLTEAQANGDATTDVILGKATGGGTPIASTLVITAANTADGQSNDPGMIRAIRPLAGGVDMASTDHVWLDVADDVAGTRSAGKVKVFAIFQKSA
jgi:hypothetical protein